MWSCDEEKQDGAVRVEDQAADAVSLRTVSKPPSQARIRQSAPHFGRGGIDGENSQSALFQIADRPLPFDRDVRTATIG